MDNIKKDIEEVGVTEADVQDRLWWRQAIHCGNPRSRFIECTVICVLVLRKQDVPLVMVLNGDQRNDAIGCPNNR